MNTQTDLDLTVMPFQHHYWHVWSLHAARTFVWVGFWIAAYRAWSEGDWGLLIVSLMLLGIGLLIFRGVAYFMNVWVLCAQYISLREIREEMEIRDANE
ncbi:MAG: hypothetical protein V3R88_04975 [Alphaproteobacteria bacterium]